jgi:hypothetical protein
MTLALIRPARSLSLAEITENAARLSGVRHRKGVLIQLAGLAGLPPM